MHANFWHLFSNMFGLWVFGEVLERLWGSKRFLTFYFLCGIGAGLIQLAFLWYDYQPLVNAFVQLKEHLTPENAVAFFQHFGLTRNSQGADALQQFLADPSDVSSRSNLISFVSEITYSALSNPTIGASGAVFGVMAAFIYLFPNVELYIYLFLPVKAKWVGLLYFGYEIYSGVLNNQGDNVAHWAHIGGGLVGFLLVLTWNKKNRRQFY